MIGIVSRCSKVSSQNAVECKAVYARQVRAYHKGSAYFQT
jgi:hypothetical protein